MKYSYAYISDYFKLSTWEEDLQGSFGLQPPPGDWETFKKHIRDLQAQCPEGESIKVIFAARHGQAEHNLIKDKFKVADEIVLHPILDPDLTDLGRSQASALGEAFEREAKRGMPLPQKWFVSPLKRPGETCGLEWGWLFGDKEGGGKGHGVPAIAIEKLREHLHVHQCDKRAPLSEVKQQFPSFTYTPETTEDDDLWKDSDVRGRETEEELVARTGAGIAQALEMSEGDTYISVTSHSGALRGIYTSLGVPARSLNVGEMNILVLRIKKA